MHCSEQCSIECSQDRGQRSTQRTPCYANVNGTVCRARGVNAQPCLSEGLQGDSAGSGIDCDRVGHFSCIWTPSGLRLKIAHKKSGHVYGCCIAIPGMFCSVKLSQNLATFFDVFDSHKEVGASTEICIVLVVMHRCLVIQSFLDTRTLWTKTSQCTLCPATFGVNAILVSSPMWVTHDTLNGGPLHRKFCALYTFLCLAPVPRSLQGALEAREWISRMYVRQALCHWGGIQKVLQQGNEGCIMPVVGPSQSLAIGLELGARGKLACFGAAPCITQERQAISPGIQLSD